MQQEIKILGASAPTWGDSDKTIINLMVRFSTFPDRELPFTANPDDVSEHGRELFSRAKFGEFGAIAPYAGMTQAEEAQRQFEIDRAKELASTEKRITMLERIVKLGLADAADLAELEALEIYSVTLHRAKGPELPARV